MVSTLTRLNILKPINLMAILMLIATSANAQFLDLNIVNPKLTVEGAFYSNSGGSISHEQRLERIGLQFPIKTKLKLGLDWREMLKSGSIKEAIKTIQPKAYQITGNIDFLHGSYNNNWSSFPGNQELMGGKFGLTGVHMWIKNKKAGTFVWNANVGFMEDLNSGGKYKPSISGTMGTGGLIKLKTIWFAGVYVNYYDRFFITPVLVLNGKISKKWRYSLIAPKELKLIYKNSKKWKQDFVFGIDANQFKSQVNLGENTSFHGFSNRLTYLKGSTQTRLKLGKKIHFYLEGGYFFHGRYTVYNTDTELVFHDNLNGGWFVKSKITLAIGKSLINSGPLNLDF
ncbi:MAG: hypothetical protein ACI9J3_003169 [Parvicellaceae bacterium]